MESVGNYFRSTPYLIMCAKINSQCIRSLNIKTTINSKNKLNFFLQKEYEKERKNKSTRRKHGINFLLPWSGNKMWLKIKCKSKSVSYKRNDWWIKLQFKQYWKHLHGGTLQGKFRRWRTHGEIFLYYLLR